MKGTVILHGTNGGMAIKKMNANSRLVLMGLVTDYVSYYGSGLKTLESRMRSLAKKCDLWRSCMASFRQSYTTLIYKMAKNGRLDA
jgi:hypothetical protein